jgi:hypothetical protein
MCCREDGESAWIDAGARNSRRRIVRRQTPGVSVGRCCYSRRGVIVEGAGVGRAGGDGRRDSWASGAAAAAAVQAYGRGTFIGE